MRDVTIEELTARLDLHNPRWMFELADSVDLKDALDAKCRDENFDVSAFLTQRCMGKVQMIAHAHWCCLYRE